MIEKAAEIKLRERKFQVNCHQEVSIKSEWKLKSKQCAVHQTTPYMNSWPPHCAGLWLWWPQWRHSTALILHSISSVTNKQTNKIGVKTQKQTVCSASDYSIYELLASTLRSGYDYDDLSGVIPPQVAPSPHHPISPWYFLGKKTRFAMQKWCWCQTMYTKDIKKAGSQKSKTAQMNQLLFYHTVISEYFYMKE